MPGSDGRGAIIVGKTNTPEFGFTGFTKNRLYGVTRNPWDRERTPGGSSGGSAAAVASGMVPFATGSDAGGSIRIPACYSGCFGLKPTFGRIPLGPSARLHMTRIWTLGPLTRTVGRRGPLPRLHGGKSSGGSRFSTGPIRILPGSAQNPPKGLKNRLQP